MASGYSPARYFKGVSSSGSKICAKLWLMLYVLKRLIRPQLQMRNSIDINLSPHGYFKSTGFNQFIGSGWRATDRSIMNWLARQMALLFLPWLRFGAILQPLRLKALVNPGSNSKCSTYAHGRFVYWGVVLGLESILAGALIVVNEARSRSRILCLFNLL